MNGYVILCGMCKIHMFSVCKLCIKENAQAKRLNMQKHFNGHGFGRADAFARGDVANHI